MKILITGIAGFVGSTIARELIKNGHNISGVDNFSYGYPERIKDIKKKINFYENDLNDFSINDDIDLIINCAAIAPLPNNQESHKSSLINNVATCGSITDLCLKNGIKKIIHFSSSAVYENGPSNNGKLASEKDSLNPKLMYPVSKYLSEEYFKTQSSMYGLDIFCLRLFNLYGPRQDYFRKQPPLIGYLLESIIRDKPITLYASENAKRDYIYIDDLMSLLNIIINNNAHQGFFAFNVGSGKSYSVYDIVNLLSEVTKKDIKFKKGQPKAFWNNFPSLFDSKIPLPLKALVNEVNKNASSDISYTKKMFKWKPEIEMKDGLNECLKYAKDIIK